METNIFNGLYKRIWSMRVTDFPPAALSGLLHGYLSMDSMVQVNPWLEEEYNTLGEIYDRIREIGRVLSNLVKDPSIHVEERVGYVADLMDCYLVYSDMKYVNTALDAAYEILSLENNGKEKEACRTPEMCRMLYSCYYFTNEEECARLAGELVKEWKSERRMIPVEIEWRWVRALEFYNNTMGYEKFSNSQILPFWENIPEIISEDSSLLTLYFDILSAEVYEKMRSR